PDNKDNVGLRVRVQCGELPYVNTTQPIASNLNCQAGLPLAFDKCLRAVFRSGLGAAVKGPPTEHESPSFATIITHPIDVDLVLRGGVRADENGQSFAGPNAGVGTVPFNCFLASPAIFGVGPNFFMPIEQPVRSSSTLVFAHNRILLGSRHANS